ncbi:PPC domain-containing DNA-binding protein [Candidatus Tisiphia endosymbiont of Nemotelus uliginosus]|uniref:PPC domain-containing DNA-binding protein n=1 Tax=Candidatus Tisiphia endosymbiont of Nemotelus uliginosus TaxID=3077926 RepID=UPI0035C8FD45
MLLKPQILLLSMILLSFFSNFSKNYVMASDKVGSVGIINNMITSFAKSNNVNFYAIRIHPGQDLKKEINKFVINNSIKAGAIVTGVGSLRQANLRLANEKEATMYKDKFEIVSLVGTIGLEGQHLHISISDKTGKTVGGHLMDENIIYTTAEIVIIKFNDLLFSREMDSITNCKELVIKQS